MKAKIEVTIDIEVVKRAERQAAKEGRVLSELIQNALDCYLSGRIPEPAGTEKAYYLFCEQPMRITREQFRKVLLADAFWNGRIE